MARRDPGVGPIEAFVDDYDFLSNFFYAPARWESAEYPTLEHAFQAAKTPHATERRAIRDCSSPSQAKRMGRKVTLRDDWESVKVSIMESLVREKFTVHAELKAKLLETGDRRLIEGNTWNDRSGVCAAVTGRTTSGESLCACATSCDRRLSLSALARPSPREQRRTGGHPWTRPG